MSFSVGSNLAMLSQLQARQLPYNMYGVLQLDMFNPCTWDIFQTPSKKELTHLRVRGVTFRMREGFFQVKEFGSCEERRENRWVPSQYTEPTQLRRFLYNEIVSSMTMRDRGGKDCAVVFPKDVKFRSEWIGSVFYPNGINVDDSAVLQVIGWSDKINPVWSEATLNETRAVEGPKGIQVVPGKNAEMVFAS